MKTSARERRTTTRTSVIFPLITSDGLLGETVNISKKGLCLSLEKDVKNIRSLSIKIESVFGSLEKIYLNLVWRKGNSLDKRRFLCGGYFLNLDKKGENLIERMISEFRLLNPEFVQLAFDLRIFLSNFKKKCEVFDLINESQNKQIEFIERNKQLLFSKLDEHFKKTWQIIKSFNKEEYEIHQRYYQKMLHPLLKDPVETNRIVCDKPLGYAGDYFIINYFYNFHNQYIGSSTYEKLINFYTCNIPIALSVVERKNFLKRIILEVINKKENSKILSVGCGATKELIELLEEEKITRKVYFDCLDFEKRALEFVKKEVEKIEEAKKKEIQLRLIHRNILNLMKDDELKDLYKDYDLIYSTGVFDYLSSRIAKRIIEKLYKLLKKEGRLLITNVRKEEENHRSYYETLGEWNLYYRDKREIVNWVENINGKKEIKILNKNNSFLLLSIIK